MVQSWQRIQNFVLPLAFATALVGYGVASKPGYSAEITVYKSPTCGCCTGWVEHMKARGHSVTANDTDNLDAIKRMAGIADEYQSCHTAMVEGYVIEGHVPGEDVERLLEERPKAKGLAAPGMPGGSPGMESAGKEPYDVLLIQSDGSSAVYASH